MPKLKQILCEVQLGPGDEPLTEYGANYRDGSVETFIAVPNKPIPFSILIKNSGYFAPGLAVFIYIDGELEWNRNRGNFLDPGPGVDPSKYEHGFRARQREEIVSDVGGEGAFIGRDWTFAKLQKDIEDDTKDVHAGTADISEARASSMGQIEVVILRCKHVQDGSTRLAPRQVNNEPKRGRNDRRNKGQAKPPSPDSTMPGGFGGGLFDGVNDEDLTFTFHPVFDQLDGPSERPNLRVNVPPNPPLVWDSTIGEYIPKSPAYIPPPKDPDATAASSPLDFFGNPKHTPVGGWPGDYLQEPYVYRDDRSELYKIPSPLNNPNGPFAGSGVADDWAKCKRKHFDGPSSSPRYNHFDQYGDAIPSPGQEQARNTQIDDDHRKNRKRTATNATQAGARQDQYGYPYATPRVDPGYGPRHQTPAPQYGGYGYHTNTYQGPQGGYGGYYTHQSPQHGQQQGYNGNQGHGHRPATGRDPRGEPGPRQPHGATYDDVINCWVPNEPPRDRAGGNRTAARHEQSRPREQHKPHDDDDRLSEVKNQLNDLRNNPQVVQDLGAKLDACMRRMDQLQARLDNGKRDKEKVGDSSKATQEHLAGDPNLKTAGNPTAAWNKPKLSSNSPAPVDGGGGQPSADTPQANGGWDQPAFNAPAPAWNLNDQQKVSDEDFLKGGGSQKQSNDDFMRGGAGSKSQAASKGWDHKSQGGKNNAGGWDNAAAQDNAWGGGNNNANTGAAGGGWDTQSKKSQGGGGGWPTGNDGGAAAGWGATNEKKDDVADEWNNDTKSKKTAGVAGVADWVNDTNNKAPSARTPSNTGWDNVKTVSAAPSAHQPDQNVYTARATGPDGKGLASPSEVNWARKPAKAPLPKPYWNPANATDNPLTEAAAKRAPALGPRDPYIYPSEPAPRFLPTMPEGVDTGVQRGRGANYVHGTRTPAYLDTFEAPYAVFVFKYRAKEVIEGILGRKIDGEFERTLEKVEEARLRGLPREALMKELLKKEREEEMKGEGRKEGKSVEGLVKAGSVTSGSKKDDAGGDGGWGASGDAAAAAGAGWEQVGSGNAGGGGGGGW